MGKYIDALKYGLIGLGFLRALFSGSCFLNNGRIVQEDIQLSERNPGLNAFRSVMQIPLDSVSSGEIKRRAFSILELDKIRRAADFIGAHSIRCHRPSNGIFLARVGNHLEKLD